MRTLSATLTAAQKSLSSRPAVQVQVRDRVGGVKRMLWSPLYDGAEPDSYHAAVCAGDNSLIRVRTDGTTLYWQRVASPGALSDYSQWTVFAGDVLTLNKGVALASNGAKVVCLYVADNVGVVTLYCRESADNGATWGARVQVATGGANDFEHLAAVFPTTDLVYAFYTTGVSSATLNRIIRTAGAWGAGAAWSNTASAITGIGASYTTSADVLLLVAGKTASLDYWLWGCIYGLGIVQALDTWSALKAIRKSHYGTGAAFLYPSIAWVDVYRESFVESYSGTVSYTRAMGMHCINQTSFSTILHHDDYRLPTMSAAYGFAIAHNATHVFLSIPSELYWNTKAVTTTDVSAKVMAVKQSIKPFSGELTVILDNAAGTYNPGSFDTLGYEVDFQPGYYSTAGAEYSSGQTFYIAALEHIGAPGKQMLVIHAVDAWELLARNQARTAVEFNKGSNEKTYKDLVEYFLHLAGITLTVISNSSPMTGEYPRMSIYSGQSYLAFIKSLYERLNDLAYVRGAAARSLNPSSSDASDYSYGGANHPILSGRYISASLDANRFQVQGNGVYSDAFIQDEINRVFGRFRPFRDNNADTAAKANAIATALSNKESYHASGGEISIPVNCGQELFDVITITDSRAGLASAKRRVFGIELLYDPPRGKYQMELTLGGMG